MRECLVLFAAPVMYIIWLKSFCVRAGWRVGSKFCIHYGNITNINRKRRFLKHSIECETHMYVCEPTL